MPKNYRGICPICQELYEGVSSKFRHRKCYLASRECLLIILKNKNKTKYGSSNPNWKGGKLSHICKLCGKEYRVWPRSRDSIYCSRQCAGMNSRRIKSSKCYEREARRLLESDGFYVVRSAGSLGAFDLVAIDNEGTRLIQIKSTNKKTWGWQNYAHDIGAMDQIGSSPMSTKEIWIRELGGSWICGFLYKDFKAILKKEET